MKKFGIIVAIFCVIVFSMPANAIRIGLLVGVENLKLGASSLAQVVDSKTRTVLYLMEPMINYEFKVYRDLIAIKINGKYYSLKCKEVIIRPKIGEFVSAKSKWYRGYFVLQNRGGKLTLINKLNIEDYVKGVVPAEMPSSWSYEAHKAQAIAARSYALANLGKRAKSGFDLKDTPEDQAYRGASAESERTNKAVEESYGIVLIYDMKIIPAYYSASAGGKTLASSQVWDRDLPYIRSVPSFDGNIKKNGHGVGMSQHGANNLAKKGYNAYQILHYFYKNITFARINQEYYK